MRHFYNFFTTIIMAVLLIPACTSSEDEKATVEFSQILYSMYSKGQIDVYARISEPTKTDVTIPLSFNGTAVKGTDYTTSAEKIIIHSGETKGYITITDKNMNDEKQLIIDLIAPDGYELGIKRTAGIAVSDEESLIYSFKHKEGNLLESYSVEIELLGSISGKYFKATEDINVPLIISGDGIDNISSTNQTVIIKAGSNIGRAKIKIKDETEILDKAQKVEITVDRNKNQRFLPGDVSSVKLNILGVQLPEKLLGTWKFDKIYDREELEMWFEEEEDDSALLPLKNKNFTLTFKKQKDGKVCLIPGKGDFAQFFRECEISLTKPINTNSGAIILGSYTAEESNMFMQEAGIEKEQNTYYKLSKANRKFRNDKEELGEAVVVFTLMSKDEMSVQFRDYDKPPFGINWWNDTKFDADMFSFASLFKKQK